MNKNSQKGLYLWCTPPNQLHSKVGRNAVESNLAIINDVMVEDLFSMALMGFMSHL